MNAHVDNLLSHLEKVKRTGKSTWLACCPAHEDKSPSLSIRELDDGRVLLHCFTGCDIESVLSSLGLDISALFPERETSHHYPPERRPFPSSDVLRAVGFELLIGLESCATLLSGEPFTEGDRARLVLTVGRISAAIDAAGCSHG